MLDLIRVLFWLLREALFLPIFLIGLPIVALLELTGSYSLRYGKTWHFPSWAWLWDNEDDGVCPTGYNALTWYLRNPCVNLRLLPLFGFKAAGRSFYSKANCRITPDIDPSPTGWTYAITWTGPYMGVWFTRKLLGKTLAIRFGWKLIPADTKGIPPNDGRYNGVPFAAQLHWN